MGLGFDWYGFLSLFYTSFTFFHLPLLCCHLTHLRLLPISGYGFFMGLNLWVLWVSQWILCVWILVFVGIFNDGGGGVYVAVEFRDGFCVWISVFEGIFDDGGGGVYVAVVGLVVVVAMLFVVVGCGSDLVFVLFFYLSLWVWI